MFITTFVIQLIISIEMNLLAPLAPFLSDYFNIKDNMVILFNFGYSAVGILVPFLGILSDRIGKKRVLGFALTLFLLGCITAGFAKTPIVFAFGRIFIGLGYYSLSSINLSYIAEFISYENRGLASGILRIAFGLGVIFTPIYATGLIGKFNYIYSVYLPLAVLGFIALLMLFRLPETKIESNIKFNKDEFIQLIKEKKNKLIFASLFFICTAPSLLLNFLSIHLSNEYKLTQLEIGFVYTTIAIGTIIGIVLATLLTDRIGKLRLARILFTLMVISISLIPFLKNLALIIIFTTLFILGLDGGWTSYQTFASEISTEKRGTFMSLFYMVNALTVTFYSLFGSFIYAIGGFNVAIALASICSLIGLIIVNKLFVHP
jgi:MFS family permease